MGSSLLLKHTGEKIGFVLPAEILQVSFAKQLRNFLAHFYNKINIISFEKLVFQNIQQEVVLLLCEKNNSGEHKIEHIELKDAGELNQLDISRLRSPQKKIDFKSNKWTFYFLEQKEIDFLENIEESKHIPKFGNFANVEVGITTGSNSFFTVPLSVVKTYYYNSLSLAFSEVCGRSHGGGVLELMPNEAEDILLPYHEKNADILIEIDNLIRKNTKIEELLKFTNQIILKERFGFNATEINLAHSIWKKLSPRRLKSGK